MKRTLAVSLPVLLLILAAVFVSNTALTQASGLKYQRFQNKLDDGKTIEVMYVPSTKKLAILLKDNEGNNVAGYIVKNVEKPVGEFDLSTARQFGSDVLSDTPFKVTNFSDDSASVSFTNNQNLNLQMSLQPPLYGECSSACTGPSSTWGTCFYCCVISSDC